MNNIFKYSALFVLFVLIGCEEDEALETNLTNFVSFEAAPVVVELEENATRTVEIDVVASNETNSSRTFNVLVDDENTTLQSPFNVPETVTIPANERLTQLSVEVTDDDNLGFIRQNLTITFEEDAEVDFGEPVRLEVAQECLETLVTLTINTDDFPGETTWELFDLTNTPTQIASGGPLSQAQAEVPFNFCLSAGNYGVVVYDSYGDGISTDGDDYVVTDDEGNVLASGTVGASANPGSVSSQSSATFTVE